MNFESARVNKRVGKSRNGRNKYSVRDNVFEDRKELQDDDKLVERGGKANQKRYNA